MVHPELDLGRRRGEAHRVVHHRVRKGSLASQHVQGGGAEISALDSTVGQEADPFRLLDAPQEDRVQPVAVRVIQSVNEDLRLGDIESGQQRRTSSSARDSSTAESGTAARLAGIAPPFRGAGAGGCEARGLDTGGSAGAALRVGFAGDSRPSSPKPGAR